MSSNVSHARLIGPNQWAQEGSIDEEDSMRFSFVAQAAGMYQLQPKGTTLGLQSEDLMYKLNLRRRFRTSRLLDSPAHQHKSYSQ